MPMGGLVIMLACAVSFIGGIIFIISSTKGKHLWVPLIGLGMGLGSYFWLYKYFIG